MRAIEICKTHKKSWISFAHACEKIVAVEKMRTEELNGWAKHTLTGFLNALVYNLSKSKFYISKIFNLLISYNTEEMYELFVEEFP